MQQVSDHYTTGSLETRLLEILAAAGKDLSRLSVQDLGVVDEFHVGGREATQELASLMKLEPELQIIDVGSGIGGPARFLAQEYGCSVTGIDFTEEFVGVAQNLTARTGLAAQARFCRASALALPFGGANFDRGYMIHVGMNIEDKATVFAEVGRVLKTGGLFAIYDLVRAGTAEPTYPLPWANTPDISFLAPLSAYRAGLESAGFEIVMERNRREFATAFFQRARAAGLRPVMGRNGAEKTTNLAGAVSDGILYPVELIASKL